MNVVIVSQCISNHQIIQLKYVQLLIVLIYFHFFLMEPVEMHWSLCLSQDLHHPTCHPECPATHGSHGQSYQSLNPSPPPQPSCCPDGNALSWIVLNVRAASPTCACVLSRFSRVQLCATTDCSLPGSFVRGTLQTRILEWVAMASSRGSSRPRDRT